MTPQPREWVFLPRHADLAAVFDSVKDMDCMSVVGVSNLGKSALLRSLTDLRIQSQHLGEAAHGHLFIYVDFNQMLEMSDQAFYELLLRCSIDAIRDNHANEEVLARAEAAYTGLIAPSNAFEIPLRFAQAMAAIGDQLAPRVVFLLDELDEPIAGIDGRVFLNLRALKDRHPAGLAYVTATNRRLREIRANADVGEFAELFAHHTYFISLLDEAEINHFAQRFAQEEGITFSDEDLAFIRSWAGGHPALLETTCRILGMLTGRPVRDHGQDWIIHRRAAEVLAQDLNIQGECRNIWNDLTTGEQEALLTITDTPEMTDHPDIESVAAKHLVITTGSQRCLFSQAFQDFVLRQHVTRRPPRHGLRVDPDSGDVWVDSEQLPPLTNLEYRLLLLLYGRLGKICTKDEVVEAVWGDNYMGDVDDARIEKLVSRLRQKLEPDVANPRYLYTVRGRGYKLVEN